MVCAGNESTVSPFSLTHSRLTHALAVEELLRRTAANPRIPIVAVAPEGDYENFRFYWAGRNWTRIV